MKGSRIFLIGPMGAGKSTIGEPLARQLKLPFVDMDRMIVEQTGRTIPQIFAEDGECSFRALEGRMLAELCASERPSVVATGGGIVLSAPNRERMHQAGVIIWLDVPPAIAAGRIRGDSNRPLLADVDVSGKARELDHARRPLYAGIADHQVHTDRLTAYEAVADIIVFLHQVQSAG